LSEARVLFIAAAGPRRGLQSLVQFLLWGKMHGVRSLVAVPGTLHEAETALALGADVIARATPRVIESMRPDVVVVDDAVAAQTGSWIITAQRVGSLILDVSDLNADIEGVDVESDDVAKEAMAEAVRRPHAARR
jgi:hypothetical protein